MPPLPSSRFRPSRHIIGATLFFPAVVVHATVAHLLSCLALPCLALPCLALPCLALPILPCFAYFALLRFAPFHVALLCSDLLVSALPWLCVALLCFATKVNDRGLYVPGQMWLSREDILGRARGTLRYVGMVTIILNDYPPLK